MLGLDRLARTVVIDALLCRERPLARDVRGKELTFGRLCLKNASLSARCFWSTIQHNDTFHGLRGTNIWPRDQQMDEGYQGTLKPLASGLIVD